MTEYTAAVVQAAPVAFEVSRTLEKLADLTADAARQGAELVVFPEAFLSAYPKGLDFGARIGSRSPAGRDDYRRYFDSSIELDGPEVSRLAEVAAQHEIHLVVGAIEREGGTLYCSVLFFAPEGRFLGHHRKLMPTASERLVWGFGDGSTLPVFDTPRGKLGAVICWENYMPLLRTAMYGKGIEIYCAPTVDARETWAPSMQHIAMEGRCFVLSASQFARRSDYPDDYDCIQGDDRATVMIGGGSCIVDPLGTFLAGPNYEEECILTAAIDRDAITRGKYDFDVVGHYARPDVFELRVDERAQVPVQFVHDPPSGESPIS